MDQGPKLRFCTSCQASRDATTGEMRVKPKARRWVCRVCLERKAESIYRKIEKEKRQ